MTIEKMQQILNTLNKIEVKGYENINNMFGVMITLQEEIQREIQIMNKQARDTTKEQNNK